MLPSTLKKFIELFAQIPGVGLRQAQRIAFWFLKHNKGFIYGYGLALKDMAEKLAVCEQCYFVFEQNINDKAPTLQSEPRPLASGLCQICRDPKRNNTQIAVVEKETDLISLEKTKSYSGLYHVLGGLLTPDEGNNHDLRIRELLERIKHNPQTAEIILAISHTSQGDLTALELEKLLKTLPLKITRLGLGLPRGAEVEFADEDTLTNALNARR